MSKQFYILLLCSIVFLPSYGQITDKKIVQQEWNNNHFTSDKVLWENIENMEELVEIQAVFERGDLASLSTYEENLTVFIPMDNALEKLKRKDRKAFLEKTTSTELKDMWKEYIVPGRLDWYAIKRNIENRNGASIFIRTLGKNQLEFILRNGEIYIRDTIGNEAKWVKGDFYHAHGFFHFIDALLFYDIP